MDDIERLLQENAPESVEPSPGFELRLLAALETKQLELGRVPAMPVRPQPSPDRRGARLSVVALGGLAAGLVIGLSLSRHAAPEAPAPEPLAALPPIPSVDVVVPTVTLPAPVVSAVPSEIATPVSATPPVVETVV